MTIHVNRARMSVTGTPGSGAVTLNAGIAGYRTFSAAGVVNGQLISYLIEDGTNWEYGYGVYTSASTLLTRTIILASSNSGSAISATSAAVVSVTALGENLRSSALEFYPDYATDNTASAAQDTAFDAWIADCISLGRPGHVAAGSYKLSAQHTINLHSVGGTGIKISGDGIKFSKFLFDTGVTAPNLQIIGSDTPLSADSLNYGVFSNIGIFGNTSGIVFAIGRSDFGDAVNSFRFLNLFVSNASTAGTATAVQVNYVLSGILDIQANGGGYNASTKVGSGFAAMDVRQAKFCAFYGSYGLSGAGLLLRDGFNQGNNFIALDLEASTTNLIINNSDTINNLWSGGENSIATTGLAASAGSKNLILCMNFEGNTTDKSGTTGVTFLP